MRTAGRRIRGWVSVAVVGTAAHAAAQHTPAARLVPIDPNNAPAVPVARSAFPDIPDADIAPVPVQGYPGQPRAPQQPQQQRSWAGNAWAGMKELVTGRPTPPPAVEPPPQQPLPQAARPPVPRQNQPQPQPRQPDAPPPQQPAVYAGPPAYRWYGWGTTTPGANQYAPHGLYPKGSANWYAHTGATPGAFPVPVQFPQPTSGVEPPVYAGNPQGYDAAYVPPSAVRAARSEAEPEPVPDPRRAARVAPPLAPGLAPLPFDPPAMPAHPAMPGQPLPVSAPADRPVDLNWQKVPPGPAPLPTVPHPAPRPAAPQPSAEPQWSPSPNYPGTVVPTGAQVPASTARGQEPAPAPVVAAPAPADVPALIRAACFSRVSDVRIAERASGKLTVTFVTTTEQLAREAAALVSQLPELKPYEVRFEVQLTR